MDNLTLYKNKESFLSRFCGFLGVNFMKLGTFFGNRSEYCFLRSRYRDNILNAIDNSHLAHDVGEKVIDYDRGIADVISEPLRKYQEMDSQIKCCEEYLFDLFNAYVEGDFIKMEEIFIETGLFNHLIKGEK